MGRKASILHYAKAGSNLGQPWLLNHIWGTIGSVLTPWSILDRSTSGSGKSRKTGKSGKKIMWPIILKHLARGLTWTTQKSGIPEPDNPKKPDFRNKKSLGSQSEQTSFASYHTKKPKALKLLAELGAQHGSQEPAPKSDPASICLPERSGSADTRIDQERSLHRYQRKIWPNSPALSGTLQREAMYLKVI